MELWRLEYNGKCMLSSSSDIVVRGAVPEWIRKTEGKGKKKVRK